MSGFTAAYSATVLDAQLASGDYIAWSANGTSETGSLARTAVSAWGAAVSGSPATKSNSGALTSAAASGAVTISHFAVYSASTAGTQKTDWTALTASRTLASGDTLSIAAGALTVSLD